MENANLEFLFPSPNEVKTTEDSEFFDLVDVSKRDGDQSQVCVHHIKAPDFPRFLRAALAGPVWLVPPL